MQRLEQSDPQRRERRIAAVARPRRGHRDHVDDARRTFAEEDDAVRQVHRFVEVMRDE